MISRYEILYFYSGLQRIFFYKKEIKNTKYKISKICLDENKEHDWITERDEGPYGERFTYCKKCKIDIHGDYFHY